MGVLYGVGVGPGDPELMTLKAIRTIENSDFVIVPCEEKEDSYAYKIVKQVIADIDKKDIKCMPFPMIKDKDLLDKAHDSMALEIMECMNQGDVALLTIGDPAIYSTYMYIHNRVAAKGRDAIIINGVPSFCAVASRLGISLGEKSEEIHIIPGSYDLKKTLDYYGTCIYMKSGRALAELIEHLEAMMQTRKMMVYAVSNCGLENEKIYYSLDELRNNSDTSYLTVVISKDVK